MHSLTHALVTLPAMLGALRYHWNQLRRSAGNPQHNRDRALPSDADPAPPPWGVKPGSHKQATAPRAFSLRVQDEVKTRDLKSIHHIKLKPMNPKFYTPSEASDLLGISKRTLRRAVKAGELPCVQYNARVWRLSAVDLAAWYATKGGRLSTCEHKPAQAS